MKRFLLFLSLIISISALHAQKAGKTNFNKVGDATVDFKSGNGKVIINDNSVYKALQIKTDAPVHIESLSVVYQNGTLENVPVRYDFKAGVPSRAINLQGGKSAIKEVDFVYNNVPKDNSAKATVEIWGSK